MTKTNAANVGCAKLTQRKYDETPEERLARKAAAKEMKKKRKLEIKSLDDNDNDISKEAELEENSSDPKELIKIETSQPTFSDLIEILQAPKVDKVIKNKVGNDDDDDIMPLNPNDNIIEDIKCVSVLDSIKEWGLHQAFVDVLNRNGISTFFPVQSAVIPILLKSSSVPCIRPRDLCVSSPTGSGKTLAYALPITQILSTRSTVRLRALILLPSRELASQVYRVFCSITTPTDLRVAMASGQTDFSLEQEVILGQGIRNKKRNISLDEGGGLTSSITNKILSNQHLRTTSNVDEEVPTISVNRYDSELYCSEVDILIATPGRLLEHLQSSSKYGFTLKYLKYIVFDEADRLLGNAYDHWIRTLVRSSSLSTSTYTSSPIHSDPSSPPLVAYSQVMAHIDRLQLSSYHIQRLLFSATLTDNPRKLSLLGVHCPLIIRAKITASLSDDVIHHKSHESDEVIDEVENEEIQRYSKKQKVVEDLSNGMSVYNVPVTLKEFICIADTAKRLEVLLSILTRVCTKNNQNVVSNEGNHDDLRERKNSSLDMINFENQNLILIFCSSVEATHKLCRILQIFNGQLLQHVQATTGTDSSSTFLFGGEVREMSSLMRAGEREEVMSHATFGNRVRILVSSDQLARGIDLPNIKLIINYDPPKYAKTYVHRVGRTARAGREGYSITMLKIGQSGTFYKMRKDISTVGVVNNNTDSNSYMLDKVKIDQEDLKTQRQKYLVAMKILPKILNLESSNKIRVGDYV